MAKQYQIPGGAYVNETGTSDYQIPGSSYVNETVAGSFSGTPGVASLVKTGQAPTLVIGFSFTPGVASLVKTGQQPTLQVGYSFTPGTASLTKTGQVPVLTTGFAFTPGIAALLKTGQVPSITITGIPSAVTPAAPDAGGIPRRHRLVVEVDGKEYPVRSAADAAAILRKVRNRTKRAINTQLRQIVADPQAVFIPPGVPEIRLIGDATTHIERQIAQFQIDMDALFEEANRRAQRALAERDDEDILLLL